jgi:hypothetical protein
MTKKIFAFGLRVNSADFKLSKGEITVPWGGDYLIAGCSEPLDS